MQQSNTSNYLSTLKNFNLHEMSPGVPIVSSFRKDTGDARKRSSPGTSRKRAYDKAINFADSAGRTQPVQISKNSQNVSRNANWNDYRDRRRFEIVFCEFLFSSSEDLLALCSLKLSGV